MTTATDRWLLDHLDDCRHRYICTFCKLRLPWRRTIPALVRDREEHERVCQRGTFESGYLGMKM